MKLRTLTATALTAGVLTTGVLTTGVGAVAAYADATPTPAPAPAPTGQSATPKFCVQASDRITRLQTRETKIQGNLDRLHQALDKANAAEHPKVASRVGTAIGKRQKAHDHVNDRIVKLKQTCNMH